MVERAAAAIDLERFPIHESQSQSYLALLAEVRQQLKETGCARLKSFVNSAAARALQDEVSGVAGQAYRSYNKVNPYFTADDPTLPASHPRRHFERRSNAFIPADSFGANSLLRAIYEWQPFTDFIRLALGESEDSFFQYDDPLADVIVNAVDPGDGFPWHFDTNTYTVTLGIQPGEGGGTFQYHPKLRSKSGENYDRVAAVLGGDLSGVRSLTLGPGDLQIFLGRYSLHRVTAVTGTTSRYVGIFSYANEPQMCGRVERTRQLYGRVLDIHLQREALLRGDTLHD
ncbi:HalD/BesD family halogenase [Limibacillus halophilus]|uniref:Fe2OG dioxygenase domain-containing protein n=1 Tax=Limibacillus halophilus TaxID=1579333 RepID=A0A839SS56_9PROT|nr:hypothetical protein [Limibacillus halophilus]MBB3065148.1 hypothetical protein [Limibacillus halophilus]